MCHGSESRVAAGRVASVPQCLLRGLLAERTCAVTATSDHEVMRCRAKLIACGQHHFFDLAFVNWKFVIGEGTERNADTLDALSTTEPGAGNSVISNGSLGSAEARCDSPTGGRRHCLLGRGREPTLQPARKRVAEP